MHVLIKHLQRVRIAVHHQVLSQHGGKVIGVDSQAFQPPLHPLSLLLLHGLEVEQEGGLAEVEGHVFSLTVHAQCGVEGTDAVPLSYLECIA